MRKPTALRRSAIKGRQPASSGVTERRRMSSWVSVRTGDIADPFMVRGSAEGTGFLPSQERRHIAGATLPVPERRHIAGVTLPVPERQHIAGVTLPVQD